MANGIQIALKCNLADEPSQRLTVYGSGRIPHVFRGNAVDFTVAIYNPDGTIKDLSDVATLKLSYMPTDRTTAAVATDSVSVTDATFTQAEFAAGTKYHAKFSFSETDMNPTISSGLKNTYWMVLSGTHLTGGYEITYGGNSFEVEEDGTANTVTSPDAPAVGITSAQADAQIDSKIAAIDYTDGATLDGDHVDIDYTPSNYTPAITPAEAADVDDLAAHLYGIDQAIATATNPDLIGQAEAEAGTATTERLISAERLAQAIAALQTGEANPDLIGQAEAEAGVATTERLISAERLAQAIAALETGEANPDLISQAEAEAGVATTERLISAERLAQAIAALQTGEANPATVSQAEAEAGTATTARLWTAQRVAQAIAALETTGTPTVQTLTSSTSITPDASSGLVCGLTLAHNTTLNTPTNMTSGEELVIVGQQDASGGKTLTLSGITEITNSASTWGSANSNAEFEIRIRRVGANYWAMITLGNGS